MAAHTVLSARNRERQRVQDARDSKRARVQTAAGHHLSLLMNCADYGSKLLEGTTPEEKKTLVQCNAWVSYWAHQHAAGLISEEHLRTQLADFLDGPSGMDYWEWAREAWAKAPVEHYFQIVRRVGDEAAHERGLRVAA
ncbi:hypothetical protein GCM10010329_78280 [Streptomyces spiroverticillatus]|uniref:Uncharacterized protein n=1 Tax=Streptomyces finlayi TaxID=67296 RepID=A0A918X589_9ACTN|nr:hypothetical protein GCM10010329_78280 [Streptomyces spiroverticillatus]GHD13216.1 hypothetical protein GCM10010334_71070 [Streptomyces finlayi]